MIHNSATARAVRTLTELLAEKGPVTAQEALTILRQLLGVVHRLHASGRIHRCIGPDTVLLNAAGNIGLTPPPALAEMGSTCGSLETTPPELQLAETLAFPADIEAARALLTRARIELDPRRIDLYQIGAVLCRMLTGDSVSSYLHSPSAKVKVPPAVQPLLERALGYKASERFADCDEFLTALNHVATDQAPRASAETPSQGSPTVAEAIKAQVGCAPTVQTPQTVSQDIQEIDLPFAQLGHYRILKRLGRGGMGDVYLGHEDALQRSVAIKVLREDLARNESFVQRFHAEASSAAKVTHPNVVPIFFIGKEGTNHFFTMQYVEGESLDRLLARQGRLKIDETLTILEQCLAGLGAAHQAGLIHRDVKPGNILVENKTGRALVADFGLAKSAEAGANMTATGMIVGTVDYIAPEQALGQKVDARADLYALGVLAYQLLSGRLPFQADTPSAVLFQHVYEKPPPLRAAAPEVPATLAAVVEKLLAKDPNDRYQSCAEVLAALRDRQAPVAAAAAAAKVDQPAPVPAARASRLVSSAEIEKIADLPIFFEEPVTAGWWPRWQGRVRALFQAHAPEFVRQLQNTGQQVDGAIAEYQKRRDRLACLVHEAQEAHEEMESQARDFRAEASAAGRRAESVQEESAVRGALQEQEKWAQSAAELEQQAAEQQEQLATIRGEFVKADATLVRLQSQRAALNARLRAAEAQLHSNEDRPRSRRRWLKAAALLPWWLWLAGAGGLFAVMLCVVLVSSKKEPAVPQEEMQVAHRDPVTHAKTPASDKPQPVPEPEGPPPHATTSAPDKPKSIPQAPAGLTTAPIEPAGKVEPPAKTIAPPALQGPAPGAVVEKPLVKQIENSIGMKLNQIPAGKFLMGVPARESSLNNVPQHEVTISRPFYLGTYEVTLEQYKIVMGDFPVPATVHGESFPDLPYYFMKTDRSDCYPANVVLWSEAVEYCKKLSDWPGEKKAGRRYRLPTEAEWEYACRAGSKRDSPPPHGTALDRDTKIGRFPPNDFGLYDMYGNVSEWCADWYDVDYYKYSPAVDPQGPVMGSHRVVRNDAGLRGVQLLSMRPHDKVGFRVLCTLEAEQKPASSAGGDPAATDARPYPVSNSLWMKFIRIPAGKFLMGSADGAAKDEVPRHEVEIGKPFYLGVHEVAQAQYARVMGWDPSQFAPAALNERGRLEAYRNQSFPVEKVSWYDAMIFCELLSRMPEEKAAGRSYRLPTEAEWEYACRAGTDSQFHYGDSLSSGQANLDGNHPFGDAGPGPFLQKTNEIGSYRPNAFGLYNVHGNVSEWCADYYDKDYYRDSPRQDPPGPKKGERRVLRGGSWKAPAQDCRSACRRESHPEIRDGGTGLRVVCVIATEPTPAVKPADGTRPPQQPPIANSIGMKLAAIPAGKFIMGSTVEFYYQSGVKPVELPHEVVITKPYHMGVYEVTQAEFVKVTGKNPRIKNRLPNPDHPVHPVSWGEAVEFCKMLTELPEEKKAGRVYRLPTEAEWEYACRAGTMTLYSFGNFIAFKQANFNYPNWGGRRVKIEDWAVKVGSYPANAFGLHDMHGNVMEYCQDWYDSDYYKSSPREDPQGPSSGGHHVVRGGAWHKSHEFCRSSCRMSDDFHTLGGLTDLAGVGFRVVCTIEAKPKP